MGGSRLAAAENEVVVTCGGADHVIRWVVGSDRIELLGHPGARDADDVLVALSGGPARCRTIEEAWNRLDRTAAAELLDCASPERLVRIAQRLPVTLEQRERVRRRDDLSERQRTSLLARFDQAAYVAEVAALGPVLAQARAESLAGPAWRRALRRARRVRARGRLSRSGWP